MKLSEGGDAQSLANIGSIFFAFVGLVGMLIFGGVAFLVTKDNTIRMSVAAIPFVITLIAIVNLQLQARAEKK